MKKKVKLQPVSGRQIKVTLRRCGWPKIGAAYIYVASEELAEIDFAQLRIDPPVSVENMQLSALGMSAVASGNIGRDGKEIYDIWDCIGAGQYTPESWMAEVREKGFHQLICSAQNCTFPFEKISEDSQYYAWHSQAGRPTSSDEKPYSAIFFRLPIGRMAEFLIYKDTGTEKLHEKTVKNLEKLDQRLFQLEFVEFGTPEPEQQV